MHNTTLRYPQEAAKFSAQCVLSAPSTRPCFFESRARSPAQLMSACQTPAGHSHLLTQAEHRMHAAPSSPKPPENLCKNVYVSSVCWRGRALSMYAAHAGPLRPHRAPARNAEGGCQLHASSARSCPHHAFLASALGQYAEPGEPRCMPALMDFTKKLLPRPPASTRGPHITSHCRRQTPACGHCCGHCCKASADALTRATPTPPTP